jgi:formamidopyrimidine-DNA glycosylase
MPELPEVETIRRDLQNKIIGKKIADVFVNDKRTIKSDLGEFKKTLVGNKFVKIERRGKLLIFVLANKKFLLIHLKMTGQLIYKIKIKNEIEIVAGGHSESTNNFHLPDAYTRVIINFVDKSTLFFNDMRIFGYMKIVDEKEKERIIKENFGIEPDELKVYKVTKFIKL